ncbi:MAG: hypothetical protein IKN55_04250, partial [Oscillospiraceae bacterium]|nr:hypothetical protein [Oscillospiraceae bacterium]
MRNLFTKAMAAIAAAAVAALQFAAMPAVAEKHAVPDFTSLGAVGTLTAEQSAAVAGAIYQGLAQHADSVDFTGLEMEPIAPTTDNMYSIHKIYNTVANGWEVGILAKREDTSYAMGASIMRMRLTYWADNANYAEEYAAVTAELDTICEGVDPAWSAVEKALYLHEYLSVHFDYDHDHKGAVTSDEDRLAHTAYGMLRSGKAVCEGYTWLYNTLLRRVGVESVNVVSQQLNHTWNLVRIGDAWYHVDVTWDDCNDGHPGMVSHEYFLKNTAAMKASEHDADDWVLTTGRAAEELPDSDLYQESFWNRTEAAVQYYQDRWLIVEPDVNDVFTGHFNLYTFNPATGEESAETYASQTQMWPVYGLNNKVWQANFIIPAVCNGIIYYTTPESIMAITYARDRHAWVCNPPIDAATDGYIYGMYTEGNTLHCFSSTGFASPTQEFCILLDDFQENTYQTYGMPQWVERTSHVKLTDTEPTEAPTEELTEAPTEEPTEAPTEEPTEATTEEPTEAPTEEPTEAPTEEPTEAPTEEPTEAPTEELTEAPTEELTEAPTEEPTEAPTEEPTEAPTEGPTE